MIFRSSILAKAPAPAVFESLCRIDQIPQWAGAVLEAQLLDSGQLRPGFRYRLRSRFPVGEQVRDFEVTLFEPHALIEYQSIDSGYSISANFQLTVVDDLRTHLTHEIVSTAAQFHKLDPGSYFRDGTLALVADLNRLARLIESSYPLVNSQ